MKASDHTEEVEAFISSRPLVYLEDDINSNSTLTPSNFLTLNPKIGIPKCEIDDNDQDFRSRYPAQIGNVPIKDNLPRGSWRKGKLIELMTSFDEQVRAAKIKLASKRVISRPLNLLYPH